MAVCLHDKHTIERILRKNTCLNIYGIGDLDDFFWPHTVWYASKKDASVTDIALLYAGSTVPTLLAFSDRADSMANLLTSISHLLPYRFYGHLSPGVESALDRDYRVVSRGRYLKMGLTNRSVIDACDCIGTENLEYDDLEEITSFYSQSYPGNYFDPGVLKTGQYFGVRWNGSLVSAAGVHVYSEEYRVAALGNIATAPSFRNRGYGTQVTAATCQSLLNTVEYIGLNVKTDNYTAISCYEKLGFETIALYNEFMFERRQG